MKNGTLAIYDSDVDYIHHLSEYLRLRDDFPYDIIVFSDLDAFNKSSLNSIDIFITSQIPNFISEKDIGDVFYLTVDNISTFNNYVCLFKYQPADTLIRTIMENAHNNVNTYSLNLHKNCHITGIYSPINRCGKTSLAISLGLSLAADSSTLLISFDSFSVIKDLVKDNSFRDISDLLFYYKEDSATLKTKLLSISYKYLDLNFICPPVTPKRIKTTDVSLWCSLIDEIAKSGLYNNIVIDISDSFSSLENFFMLCDRIFMPQLNDYVSTKKIDSFFDYFSHISNLDKGMFNRINLPVCDDFFDENKYLNWLTEGSLSSFSKALIGGLS